MRRLRLLLLLLIISFIGILNVKAVDTSEKVYDFANVLTTEEKELLKEKIDKYIETYNMDMAVVTVKYHNYYSTEQYADEFYDTNGFGIGSTEDGLVCVIDFSKGISFYEHISTKGNAIIMYDDYRINKILDAIDDEYYKDNTNYYMMFDAFIDKSSYYASLGIPDSNKNVRLDDNGMPYEIKPFPWFGISLASLITSTIIVLVLVFRNKMVHKAKNADEYIDKGSINITNRVDQFVTTNTTRVRVSSPSSGGGGGHAGGSSFHSSGGGFHGGGGRSH